jgi:hypothetical protein
VRNGHERSPNVCFESDACRVGLTSCARAGRSDLERSRRRELLSDCLFEFASRFKASNVTAT